MHSNALVSILSLTYLLTAQAATSLVLLAFTMPRVSSGWNSVYKLTTSSNHLPDKSGRVILFSRNLHFRFFFFFFFFLSLLHFLFEHEDDLGAFSLFSAVEEQQMPYSELALSVLLRKRSKSCCRRYLSVGSDSAKDFLNANEIVAFNAIV